MNHAFESATGWATAARSALVDRWTLLCNHVLRAEPAATERLARHAGRVVSVEMSSAMPSVMGRVLVPDAGPVRWRVTPAGLLEHVPEPNPTRDVAPGTPAAGAVADACITLHPSPWGAARALATGDTSALRVHGEVQALVDDVRWIVDHVRWDVAADASRWLPAPMQAPAARAFDVVADGSRRLAKAFDAWLPKSGDHPPR